MNKIKDMKVDLNIENNDMTLGKNVMAISSDGIFYSIQGEGISMGEPAVFLRLYGCNLHCSYCDTPYTWGKDTNKKIISLGITIITLEKLAEDIQKLWPETNKKCKTLVITGGEPLLQKEAVDNLMKLLPDWFVEIETNGTILPTKKQLNECQFNCSPKLSNSGNDENRINGKVLKAINKNDSQFKFVVRNEDDVKEIERDFIKPYKLDTEKIILMPEGISVKELRKHAVAVVDICLEKGYRLLDRLQINIWGKKRRV
ncbi:MAG: 7-carboxy-7-deazaguanine synthase QueE [Candidatus Paceibacterota bacterium]|jgi:organic radical activating enzyme